MDFFIRLPSLAGIYDLPSKSNYAAGSAFLEALAQLRAADKFSSGTSVSLDLGWMQTIGIVAERADYRHRRERTRDMIPIQKEDLLALLEHYCNPDLSPPGPEQSQILVGSSTPMDSYARGDTPPAHLKAPLFAPFDVVRARTAAGPAISATQQDMIKQFWSAGDIKGRAVVEVLKGKLVHALGVQVEDIDSQKSLADYGVDSLMAMELRNLIWRDFGVSVAEFEIMRGKDILAVGELVARKAE